MVCHFSTPCDEPGTRPNVMSHPTHRQHPNPASPAPARHSGQAWALSQLAYEAGDQNRDPEKAIDAGTTRRCQDEPAARPLRLQVLLGCTSPARGSDPGPWSERLAELVELIVSDDGAGSRILPDPCAFKSRPRRQAPLVEDGVALQQRRCRRHGSCAAPLWMHQLSTVRQGPCPRAQAWVGFARRRRRRGGGSSFHSAFSPGPGAGLARNQRDGGNHGASGARGRRLAGAQSSVLRKCFVHAPSSRLVRKLALGFSDLSISAMFSLSNVEVAPRCNE